MITSLRCCTIMYVRVHYASTILVEMLYRSIWLQRNTMKICMYVQNDSELFGRTIRVNLAKPMKMKDGVHSRAGEIKNHPVMACRMTVL